jgi:hypothetical protein
MSPCAYDDDALIPIEPKSSGSELSHELVQVGM